MDARRLPAGHGMLWLVAGFALFRRHPPLMTLLTFGYLVAVIAVNLLPKIGPLLLPLLLPALTVVLGNGCRAVEQEQGFSAQSLGAGLSARRGVMLQLGGLHLLGSSLLVLGGSFFGDPVNIADGISPEEAVALAQDMAVILVLATPLLMAFWFAPLLAAWDGVGAAKSLFFSFVASWRNWRAFTVYGLALALVGVAVPAALLLFAGLVSQYLQAVLSTALRMLLVFVLAPTMVASIYLSYRDVFAPMPDAVDDE